MALDKFDKLEKGLGRLLRSYEAVKAENNGLLNAVRAKNQEIEELKEKVKKVDRERHQVKEKVDTLLARLDSLMQDQ
ncbi:MAG: cell division protein ZapB [Deltaproteobacteria bacterium]|nr:cell division protein ZapB [Deltaproteobacteria bacterium]